MLVLSLLAKAASGSGEPPEQLAVYETTYGVTEYGTLSATGQRTFRAALPNESDGVRLTRTAYRERFATLAAVRRASTGSSGTVTRSTGSTGPRHS